MADTWGDLRPGDTVQDKNGHKWNYMGRKGGVVTIAAEGRKSRTLTPDLAAAVTVVERAKVPTSMQECVETVQTRVGGIVIASQDANGVWRCPAAKRMDAGTLLIHLQQLHGEPMQASRLTASELRKLHTFGHEMGTKDKAFKPHEHVLG